MRTKSIATFVIFVLVIAIIASAAAGLFESLGLPDVFDKNNAMDGYGIVQGIDLVGGARLVYQAQDANGKDFTPSAKELEDTISVLYARLKNIGLTEATVSAQGDDRIVVEIPAVESTAEAAAMIGSTAKLEFRDADGNVVLDGSAIKDAVAEYGQQSEYSANEHYVTLTLKDEFVETWAQATAAAAARASEVDETTGRAKNFIAIYLDDDLQSDPSVAEEINSNTCVISGGFDAESAKQLAGVIKAGALPIQLKDIQQQTVGATLGEGVLNKSLVAGGIGILLVMLFMLIIYRVPGLIADLALVAYIGIIGLVMAFFEVNLSLSGIAGIILGIGMAVDANVVIFERIKEELKNGKTVRASVDSGFNRALTAVIDANVTTMIASVVLYIFGMNTVRGFALTLGIGIVISMITAVVVTRILLKSLVGIGVTNPAVFGVKRKGDK